MPQLPQVDEKMNPTSAKLVWHFSNSEPTKWQEQHTHHASTCDLFVLILLIELFNGPQSTTQLLVRAEMP